MLKEHNELLSRVGKGTPMGTFMRKYWVPAIQSERLVADGAPQRVRLLGEDLVAFRASDGRVGVLDEACPHRGVSLSLARNADCALQCIFHGWKIGVDGRLVDVPAEPPERRAKFQEMVKINCYPVHEAAGIVFAWLGEDTPPPFPAYNWAELPETHVMVKCGLVGASWLNGLEGQLDSAHVGILHSDWVTKDKKSFGSSNVDLTSLDLAPRFEFEDEAYGFREGAVRTMPDGQHYVRVREFVMPWYSYIPQGGGRDAIQLLTISVPLDDENSAQWDVRYSLGPPLDRANMRGSNTPPFMDARAELGTIDDRFGQDYDRIRSGSWSGFAQLRYEDYAVAMAQGPIADRTKEQLSASDGAILKARQVLRRALREQESGAAAPEFDPDIDWNVIRSFAEIIPSQADWRELPRG